jgi:5'-nucleotidase
VTPDSVDVWIRGTPAAWPDRVAPDSAIAALVERYVREIGPEVNRVVAQLTEPLHRGTGEYELGRLIADAQRAATGADVAIMNNGGIRTNVESGPVTWGELFQVQPFGNLLVELQLTGTQLRSAIEHLVRGAAPGAQLSGIVVEYDPAAPPGSRVRSMRLTSGDAIRDDRSYAVTVNDFMAEGGDGFAVFTQASARDDTGIVDLDALLDYVAKLPQPIAAPTDQRLRALRGAGLDR